MAGCLFLCRNRHEAQDQDQGKHPHHQQRGFLAEIAFEGGKVQQHVQQHPADHGPAQPLVGQLVQTGIEVEKHQHAGHGRQQKGAHDERGDPGAVGVEVHVNRSVRYEGRLSKCACHISRKTAVLFSR